jgi:4-amino-4-deoxy-L-arabinose transferase-like glycosyltransferase
MQRKALLLLILVLALVLRLYPLEQWHEWDESVYLMHAEHMVGGKTNYNEFFYRPPILPIIIAAGFLIWHHVFMASIVVALATSAVALGMYLVGARLHSEEAGLFAALIVTVQPLFVRFGHMLFTDALVATFFTFAVWCALHPGWRWAAAAGALTGVAALTKFSALATIPFVGLLVVLLALPSLDRKGLRRWKMAALSMVAYTAGAAAALLPYMAWAYARLGSAVAPFRTSSTMIGWHEQSALFYLNAQLFTVPILIGIALLALRWKDWRNDRQLRVTIIVLTLFAVSTLIYLSTFGYKHSRYGILSIAPLVLFAGIGYAAAHNAWRKRVWGTRFWVPFIVIILLFSAPAFHTLAGPPIGTEKHHAISMAERLVEHGRPDLTIYAASEYPFYAYYTNNTVVAVDMGDFIARYPEFMPEDGYLVVLKDPPQQPTTDWADSRPELTRLFENDYSIIYLYDNKLYEIIIAQYPER